MQFPYCIVWVPIPVITWLLPFVGHMGICTSKGVTLDFAGPYFISVDNLAFGTPARCVHLRVPWSCLKSSGSQDWQDIAVPLCHSSVLEADSHTQRVPQTQFEEYVNLLGLQWQHGLHPSQICAPLSHGSVQVCEAGPCQSVSLRQRSSGSQGPISTCALSTGRAMGCCLAGKHAERFLAAPFVGCKAPSLNLRFMLLRVG